MHLNDLVGNYKRKRKTKRKENHWYRLENPTGTLAAYLGKKSGASRGSGTVAAAPKLPRVTIEVLRNFIQRGSKRREK